MKYTASQMNRCAMTVQILRLKLNERRTILLCRVVLNESTACQLYDHTSRPRTILCNRKTLWSCVPSALQLLADSSATQSYAYYYIFSCEKSVLNQMGTTTYCSSIKKFIRHQIFLSITATKISTNDIYLADKSLSCFLFLLFSFLSGVLCTPYSITLHAIYNLSTSGTDLVTWFSVFVWPVYFPEITSSRLGHQKRTFGDWWSRIFTGRMPFLLPNQQCHSTEGYNWHKEQLTFFGGGLTMQITSKQLANIQQ